MAARLFLMVEQAYSEIFEVPITRWLTRRILNFYFAMTAVPVVTVTVVTVPVISVTVRLFVTVAVVAGRIAAVRVGMVRIMCAMVVMRIVRTMP